MGLDFRRVLFRSTCKIIVADKEGVVLIHVVVGLVKPIDYTARELFTGCRERFVEPRPAKKDNEKDLKRYLKEKARYDE